MQKEFTKQAEHALKQARSLAKKFHHPYVGTEHLLLALCQEFTGVAGQVLASCRVSADEIVKIIDELISPVQEVNKKVLEFSPRLEFLLDNAYQEATILKSEKIGTEHILLAMLKDGECVATRILVTLNVRLDKVQEHILDTLGLDVKTYYEEGSEGGHVQGGMLDQFGTDLTMQAAEGKLDPVIGREEEIERLMQILSRRTKNNPCLVGEPGVGKTAVVEGLARRIVEGIVPEHMKGKHIYTLDLSGMVAGSKYRGEFEDRMKKLLREVKADPNVILFLDEIHTIIGAGSAEGTLDAANILKPSMARGEIQLIGATTVVEYRKKIEKDAALERRFQPITVEEPSVELCEKILSGLQPKYEAHHHVQMEEETIKAAVELTARYIHDRHLPDKAIDVLDEACSKVRLNGFEVPKQLNQLEELLQKLGTEKEERIKAGDFAEASIIHQEQEAVVKKIDRTKRRIENAQADRKSVV